MSFPQGPRFTRFARTQPPTVSTGRGGPTLGVGSRVVVTCTGSGTGRVTLTDDSGTSALATVDEGVEVEILAWRPRRGSETRYRVIPTAGGVEGWLGAGSLKPRPLPPPKPAGKVAVVSTRVVTDGSPSARRPPALAKVAATSTTNGGRGTRKRTR